MNLDRVVTKAADQKPSLGYISSSATGDDSNFCVLKLLLRITLPASASMAAHTYLFAASTLVICLHFMMGTLADDQNLPTTMDEVIMKANRGRNSPKSGRFGEGLIPDGLDMMLTEEQHAKLYGRSLGRTDDEDEEFIKLWPGGVIPYTISPHFTMPKRNKILDAMATWEELTCVDFRETTRSSGSLVEITSILGCWSLLGMNKNGEPQQISLEEPGCFYEGTVEHELGHAIGLVHEHQRPERDDYLGVYMNHVDPRHSDQLETYQKGAVDKMGLPYDYYSIMHYGKYAFSVRPKHLITLYAYDTQRRRALVKVTDDLGKVLGPSFTDVKLVNLMYNCSASCQSKPQCGEDCFVDKYCNCFCKKDMPEVPCKDYKRNCRQWAEQGACTTDRFPMEFFCRKSCEMCAVKSTIPPEKPQIKLPCVNKDDNCQYWADMGECGRIPEMMIPTCRKACGQCVDDESSECSDNDPDCPYWRGQCDDTDIQQKCKRTCRACP